MTAIMQRASAAVVEGSNSGRFLRTSPNAVNLRRIHWVPLCMTHKTRSGYGSNKIRLRHSRGIWKNLVFIVDLQLGRGIEVDESGQKCFQEV